MTKLHIEGPDGKTYEIEGPAGTDPQAIVSQFVNTKWPNLAKDVGIEAGLNTARLAGTGAVQGIAELGDAAQRVLGPPPGGMLFKPGEQWMGAGGTKPLEALGLPTSAAKEAERLGIPMTGLREDIVAGTRTAAQVAALGGSLPLTALSGVGAGVGQELGGETGAFIGSLTAPFAAGAVRKAAPRPPTEAELKAGAKTQYAQGEASQAWYDTKDLGTLAASVRAEFPGTVISQRAYPNAYGALKHVEDTIAAGKPITVPELRELREAVNRQFSGATARETQIINTIVKKLEDMGPLEFRVGDALYRRAKRSESLERIKEDAGRKASSYPLALRNETARYMGKEAELGFYTPAEITQMKAILEGPLAQTALQLGRYSPVKDPLRFGLTQIPVAAATQGAGQVNAFMAVLSGLLSEASRQASSRILSNRITNLQEFIRRGGPAPAAPPSPIIDMLRVLVPEATAQ